MGINVLNKFATAVLAFEFACGVPQQITRIQYLSAATDAKKSVRRSRTF